MRDSKEIVVVSFVSGEATRPQGPSRANVWDHAKGYLVAPCGKNIHTLFVGEKNALLMKNRNMVGTTLVS